MTNKYLIIYFSAIHILLLIVLIKSDFKDRVKNKFWPNKTHSEPTMHYYKMLAYHKRMDGNIPQNAIIFIGDSLVQGLAVSAITPHAVNYGIGNDTTVGVINRIKNYKSIDRSKIIVFAIGQNDLKVGRKTDEILQNIEAIIKNIASNKKIIFCSIHPVDENCQNNIYRKNESIVSINMGIEKICLKYPNAHFVDIYRDLINIAGNLDNNFHIGDGIHLNTEGYNIWIESVKKKIDEIF